MRTSIHLSIVWKCHQGATTLSITTLSITTLSITTLSGKALVYNTASMTVSISDTQHYNALLYAKYRILFTILLSVIELNVVVIMLSIVMLSLR